MAGFVKLHCSILRSTIWAARPDREVFITALLLAEPWECTEEMPQLRVGSLEETGWKVPPGWYGFAEAAGPGIVRTSGVEIEEGMAALERLGEPEPESRSQAFEGRRLVRVDGGFVVLNYDKYREKDTTSALRAQRYRDRKRASNHAVTNRDVTLLPRDVTLLGRSVTQAEAEAEAEAEIRKIPPNPPGGSLALTPPEPKTRKARVKDWTPAPSPADFQPTEATKRVAKENRRNWQDDYQAMWRWAQNAPQKEGKGLKRDWNLALQNWMTSQYAQQRTQQTVQKTETWKG